MECDILFKIASGIIGSLLSNLFFSTGQTPPSIPSEVKPSVVIEQVKPEVPSFVTSVPVGHYAGIGSPSSSLSKARQSAISDVVRQILGSIDVEYDYHSVNRVTGNPRKPRHSVDDSLKRVARGIVLDVERNIVDSAWSQDNAGYLYFILVKYDDSMIAEMRRLSKGSKVVASVLSHDSQNVHISISEVNGVQVIITSADLHVRKHNKFAKTISFFVWKVPLGSSQSVSLPIDPVKVCGGSEEVRLPVSSQMELADHLLGAELAYNLTLQGHDEIGRPVSAQLIF